MSESKSITLYKRNAQGKPIFWSAEILGHKIILKYGIVGKTGTTSEYVPPRGVEKEWKTIVAAKRREGGTELGELYDNTPAEITNEDDLINYLNCYLPKYNTNNEGFVLPMLAKIYEYNNEQGLLAQMKINGVRCNISAVMRGEGFFKIKRLVFRSRKGLEYKCPVLENIMLNEVLTDRQFNRMLEDNLVLDGELYIPGLELNDILSAAENLKSPYNHFLQFWCYDLAIDDMIQTSRISLLKSEFGKFKMPNYVNAKAILDYHMNNKKRFVLIHTYDNLNGDEDIIKYRDIFVEAKFEGAILRNPYATYQFGKRNSTMYKSKPILDGKFKIIDIISEGAKRPKFSKFVLSNDINNETFECMPIGDASTRESYLLNKDKLIGKTAFVEYRCRSGVKNVPSHGNLIKILNNEPTGLPNNIEEES